MASNLPQERNHEACLLIRDLDPMVTESLLMELFIQAAPVVKVFIPKDKLTQQHSGRAYVEFQSSSDAEYALKVMKFVRLFNKEIKIKKENKDKVDIGANLFIGNLDADVDERILHDTFSRFGTIIFTPKVMRDENGVSKGFAFINFDSFEASDAAIEAMNSQFLCNKPISVTYARKKDSNERHGSSAERIIAASRNTGYLNQQQQQQQQPSSTSSTSTSTPQQQQQQQQQQSQPLPPPIVTAGGIIHQQQIQQQQQLQQQQQQQLQQQQLQLQQLQQQQQQQHHQHHPHHQQHPIPHPHQHPLPHQLPHQLRPHPHPHHPPPPPFNPMLMQFNPMMMPFGGMPPPPPHK
ncbi:hypothetical protein ACTFIW_009084 [Dictyostelium discoideum]